MLYIAALVWFMTMIVFFCTCLSICTIILSWMWGTRVKGSSRADILDSLKECVAYLGDVQSVWLDLPSAKRIHLLYRPCPDRPRKALLCIPGTGAYSIGYLELMRSLNTYTDIFVLDMPGWGISDSPGPTDFDSRFSDSVLKYYSQVIAEVYCRILTLTNTEKCDVSAHSLGAHLMIHCMARHYDILGNTRIVLMCTPGLTETLSDYEWFWGWLIAYAIPEKVLKKHRDWWDIWHCIRWIHTNSDPLTWFRTVALFNPEGEGYRVLAEHLTLCLDELVESAKKMSVTMVWGDVDTLVSIKKNKAILERLQEAGISNIFLRDAGHCLVSDEHHTIADILDSPCVSVKNN